MREIFFDVIALYNTSPRELSLGFFSADNQKRLCGPTTAVPVFEAKMTRDLRLVVCDTFFFVMIREVTSFFPSTQLTARPTTITRYIV